MTSNFDSLTSTIQSGHIRFGLLHTSNGSAVVVDDDNQAAVAFVHAKLDWKGDAFIEVTDLNEREILRYTLLKPWVTARQQVIEPRDWRVECASRTNRVLSAAKNGWMVIVRANLEHDFFPAGLAALNLVLIQIGIQRATVADLPMQLTN